MPVVLRVSAPLPDAAVRGLGKFHGLSYFGASMVRLPPPTHAPPPSLAVLLAAVLLAGCKEPPPDPPAAGIFVDRAVELGVDFVHFSGMYGAVHYAEIFGSGAALFDYDNDGDLDLYLVQGGMLDPDRRPDEAIFPPRGPLTDRLYRNELVESGELRFRDVTAEAGIDSSGYGMGVAAGDYDGDGWIDLYVTNLGSNLLLRNRGDGTFADTTEQAAADDPRWNTSVVFLDYDGDGRLDLFLTAYVDFTLDNHKVCFSNTSAVEYCGPGSYQPLPQKLLRNRGDGTFEDVSVDAQITRDYAAGLGVVWADFNGDRTVDLYVASDSLPNPLWLNSGDGIFRNTALLAGCAVNANGKVEASMGVDAADFDDDGDEDLFMTHLVGETNTLYRNDGAGEFDDYTMEAGLGAPSHSFTSFGTRWLDFDNDGLLDIAVANGAVASIEALRYAGDPFPLDQRNQLFRGVGEGRFEEWTERAGPGFELVEVSRGLAVGDIDNDGDPDLVVVNNSGPVRLLINGAGAANRWLGLRVTDASGRIDVLGARVELKLTDGRSIWRTVRPGGGYCSSHDPRVRFGLGASGRIEAVTVHWPDGTLEHWSDLAVGSYTTLRRGSGTRPS